MRPSPWSDHRTGWVFTAADPADLGAFGRLGASRRHGSAGLVEVVDADLRPPAEHEVRHRHVPETAGGVEGVRLPGVLDRADRPVHRLDQQRWERGQVVRLVRRLHQAQHRLVAGLVPAEADALEAVGCGLPLHELVARRRRRARGTDDHQPSVRSGGEHGEFRAGPRSYAAARLVLGQS